MVQDAVSAHSDLNELLGTVIFQDCVTGMRRLPPKSVDLVIADPTIQCVQG